MPVRQQVAPVLGLVAQGPARERQQGWRQVARGRGQVVLGLGPAQVQQQVRRRVAPGPARV
jgi:hypothetical protein